MNIRCERCSTTYDLDESLLAPEGSPVQCTKCQHVFTAYPPRAPGRTLVGTPSAPAPQPAAPPRPAAEPAPQPPVSARQGPAIYRPSTSVGSARTTAGGQRDTMGAVEARLRRTARLRWIVPLAVIAAVAVIGGVWALVARRDDPAATRRRSEAMALVALDDLESLEKATGLLDAMVQREPGSAPFQADRALAQVLLATGLREDVAAPAERLAAKVAERERLLAAQQAAAAPGGSQAGAAPAPTTPPVAPEALAALDGDIEGMRGQVEPRQARARDLGERAYGVLKQLSADHGNEIEVERALAVYYASTGDREQALRFIRAAQGPGARDPWIQLAEGWLDAREEGKDARERALVKLPALITSRPDVVRARFLLARTQAALGRREAAAATLDGLLAANPRHNRAARLRAELVGAVPAQRPGAPAPASGLAPAAAPTRPAPVAPVAPGVGATVPRPAAPQAPVAAPPHAGPSAPVGGTPGAAPGIHPPPALPPAPTVPGAPHPAIAPAPQPAAPPAVPATNGTAKPVAAPPPPPAPAPAKQAPAAEQSNGG